MSETQLERSVLEAKERDELFAIADALGAKPGTRAKKADLVTQILRATGIEPDDGGGPVEKPRRTRTRRTTTDATTTDAAAPLRSPMPCGRRQPGSRCRLGPGVSSSPETAAAGAPPAVRSPAAGAPYGFRRPGRHGAHSWRREERP